MTVDEGQTSDQSLSATDSDGDPLTFTLGAGPTYASVTTTSPGTGTASGNVHLAPGFTDSGIVGAAVVVSDGSLSNVQTFQITVNNVNRNPLLTPPVDMTVQEGQTADQALSGSDLDGDLLTFHLTAGPSYASVSSTGPTTGNLHLAPGPSDAGLDGAYINVTDGQGGSSAAMPFIITVTNFDRPPVVDPIANQTVAEGQRQRSGR